MGDNYKFKIIIMICLKEYTRQNEHYYKGTEYNMNPATADENEAYFGEKLWDREKVAKKATGTKTTKGRKTTKESK